MVIVLTTTPWPTKGPVSESEGIRDMTKRIAGAKQNNSFV